MSRSQRSIPAVLALALATVLPWAARHAAAQTRAGAGAELELGYGYDTNLFLDAVPAPTPGDPVTVTPAEDLFLHVSFAPRASLRLRGHALDGGYRLRWHQSDAHGSILEQSGRLVYRSPRLGRFDLTLAAVADRYRIGAAAQRVGSSWLGGGEAAVTAHVGATTRLWAGYRGLARVYPDLTVPETLRSERDLEHSALLGCALHPASRFEARLDLALTRNASNDHLDFTRGRAGGMVVVRPVGRVALGVEYALAIQRLPQGSAADIGNSGKVDYGPRTDLIHWVGAQATLGVTRGVDLFVRYDGNFSSSTDDALSYRRHAALVGVALSYAATSRVAGGEPEAAHAPARLLESSPHGDETVRFRVHAPRARAVAVIGDFNGWEAARGAMQRTADGWWQADLEVAAGRHAYVFVVDGVATRPAAAKVYEDDGFGGQNAVIVVP